MKMAEDLILKSLEKLQKIGNESEKKGDEKEPKLIFPSYSNGEKRISEQEARFLFVRELENQKDEDFYYSVETPTILKYRFSEVRGKKKEHPEINKETGESGKSDVCIYDENFDRKHLIEFKALNKNSFDFKKDFIKLKYDPKVSNEPNYFVHILKSYDAGTVKSLITKYNAAFDVPVDEKTKIDNNIEKENEIIVFLCVLEVPETYKDNYTEPLKFGKKDITEILTKLTHNL